MARMSKAKSGDAAPERRQKVKMGLYLCMEKRNISPRLVRFSVVLWGVVGRAETGTTGSSVGLWDSARERLGPHPAMGLTQEGTGTTHDSGTHSERDWDHTQLWDSSNKALGPHTSLGITQEGIGTPSSYGTHPGRHRDLT